MAAMSDTSSLRRSVSLPFLVLYGVGTMVGGGFYALLGKITGDAGSATPLAFLLSGLLALLSACAFAEMASRHPVSAGEARYVEKGLGWPRIGALVGWLVILTGIVSAAALGVATAGFLRDMFPVLPQPVAIAGVILLLGAIAAWGISQSVAVVALISVIQIAALVYVLGVNVESLAGLPDRWPELVPGTAAGIGWLGVFSGAFLAFYAFVGFEDMVNIAEEVKDVRRTLPAAIFISVILTTALYVVVSMAAVLSVPLDRLAEAKTPIAELVSGRYSETGIWAVSLLTGFNSALVQIVMVARVGYGLADRHQAPRAFGKINRVTRTPVIATAAGTGVVLALALFFPLKTLANLTSGIILVVFALVNLALVRTKRDDPDPEGEGPRFPIWLPLTGLAVTVLVLGFKLSLLVM